MKSLYSCSALSLAYPYFCCNSPRSFSLFPSTRVRSSSVSFPHFSLTPPLISFHFPFRTSSFMFALLYQFAVPHRNLGTEFEVPRHKSRGRQKEFLTPGIAPRIPVSMRLPPSEKLSNSGLPP